MLILYLNLPRSLDLKQEPYQSTAFEVYHLRSHRRYLRYAFQVSAPGEFDLVQPSVLCPALSPLLWMERNLLSECEVSFDWCFVFLGPHLQLRMGWEFLFHSLLYKFWTASNLGLLGRLPWVSPRAKRDLRFQQTCGLHWLLHHRHACGADAARPGDPPILAAFNVFIHLPEQLRLRLQHLHLIIFFSRIFFHNIDNSSSRKWL